MSKTVLTDYGLSALAREIRTRHDDMVCDIYCDGDCDICQPPGSAYHFEDEAARRWAAKKLTVPLDYATDEDDFTLEEWVEIHIELWKMKTGGTERESNAKARFQRMGNQLRNSKNFVRDKWKLSGCKEVGAKIGLHDEIDIDTEINELFDAIDDGDDEGDVSDFDLSPTSEDEGPPIPPEFNPNPFKIY